MEHECDTPKLNVWCADLRFCNWTILFLGEAAVTGALYLNMLQNYAITRIPQGYFFQQDGVPPNYANTVKTFLGQQFPGIWIGRRGPIAWPPRSPDLTPLDFFLWRYIKDSVYQMKVQDVAKLHHRITEACETVNTSDAAKHLARGGLSSQHLLGHKGRTRGDLLRNAKS
jgi:hypothetical protein